MPNWMQQEARAISNRDRLLSSIAERRKFDTWERNKERAADPLVPLVEDPFESDQNED